MKTDVVISELKKGEKLFSTIRGEIEFDIISNLKGDDYPIECKDGRGFRFYFTIEGIEGNEGKLPSLFKTSPFKETERVVMVKGDGEDDYKPRVLVCVKNGSAVCWSSVETIQGAKNVTTTCAWTDWKEAETTSEYVYLTVQDISEGKGVGVNPDLIKMIL